MQSISKQIIHYLLTHGFTLYEKRSSRKYRAFMQPEHDTGIYVFVGNHGGLRAGPSQSNSWA